MENGILVKESRQRVILFLRLKIPAITPEFTALRLELGIAQARPKIVQIKDIRDVSRRLAVRLRRCHFVESFAEF